MKGWLFCLSFSVIYGKVCCRIVWCLAVKCNWRRVFGVAAGSDHVTVSSDELVPGDLIEIPTDRSFEMPCDAALICGTCRVNESMLTGKTISIVQKKCRYWRSLMISAWCLMTFTFAWNTRALPHVGTRIVLNVLMFVSSTLLCVDQDSYPCSLNVKIWKSLCRVHDFADMLHVLLGNR